MEGVVTVSVALLEAESEEQLAKVIRPASASRESGVRYIGLIWELKIWPPESAAFGLPVKDFFCERHQRTKPGTAAATA
ncbi:hypothetical protein GCM10022408_17380 [Hymenobacter fastidiosus]|uniref:Uncharacterized protein n=1 Tax=Hymenobacter fastidiosus TaxID=486264 RepID=A0ABP7S3U1_9BACT